MPPARPVALSLWDDPLLLHVSWSPRGRGLRGDPTLSSRRLPRFASEWHRPTAGHAVVTSNGLWALNEGSLALAQRLMRPRLTWVGGSAGQCQLPPTGILPPEQACWPRPRPWCPLVRKARVDSHGFPAPLLGAAVCHGARPLPTGELVLGPLPCLMSVRSLHFWLGPWVVTPLCGLFRVNLGAWHHCCQSCSAARLLWGPQFPACWILLCLGTRPTPRAGAWSLELAGDWQASTPSASGGPAAGGQDGRSSC